MGNFKDRVTIYEVAKASGVSLATVSRVINKQSNVTEATRKKVEDTIERLGYKPSALAQGLATNRTTNIGIILPAANYVYISNMLSGMVDIGKIYGYQTTLFVTSHSKEDAQGVMEKLITSHCDGAIIFDDILDAEDIQKILSYKIPLVVIGHNLQGEGLGSITLDYRQTLIDVIKDHFVKHPENKVHFLHIPNGGKLMSNLEDAALEQCDISDPDGDNSPIVCDDSYTRTYRQFVEYFKTNRSGYFVSPRDSLACAISNAALDSDLRIPEDVEIISVIGTKYSKISRPAISSLNIDMFEVGSIAMRMVTKLLKEDLDSKIFNFNSNFVIRGSTKK